MLCLLCFLKHHVSSHTEVREADKKTDDLLYPVGKTARISKFKKTFSRQITCLDFKTTSQYILFIIATPSTNEFADTLNFFDVVADEKPVSGLDDKIV